GEQSFMVYNMSVAKEINDKLSIGVGVECIEMKDKLVMKVPYSFLGYSIPGITDIDYNRSACGFQGNIGVMYKPVDKLSTGFLLRSGTYIGLPKESNSSNSSFVNGYTYPMTMELGASYNVLDPLTVAFAVSYNKYSWTSVNYTDTVQFRVGTEYKATDKLALHLGFFTDPNIYKDSDSYNITNIDMYNMQYLCIGAEYDITTAMNLGLTYTHSFTQDVVNNGITYEYPADMFRFDIGYKF
ncbi:MAG: outer membrane protein transport protein, partial [Endomicrobiia bacterium]